MQVVTSMVFYAAFNFNPGVLRLLIVLGPDFTLHVYCITAGIFKWPMEWAPAMVNLPGNAEGKVVGTEPNKGLMKSSSQQAIVGSVVGNTRLPPIIVVSNNTMGLILQRLQTAR